MSDSENVEFFQNLDEIIDNDRKNEELNSLAYLIALGAIRKNED